MASLINYASIVANEVSLIDTSGTSATEIRDLFTTVAQLQLKRDIADSYSDESFGTSATLVLLDVSRSSHGQDRTQRYRG